MEKESTISYKVYPNERLKKVSFHGKESYPLYIQVIYDRKPVYFKSYFFDLLSKEKYALNYVSGKISPSLKEIIGKEEGVLRFLTVQNNKNFAIGSLQKDYCYYSKDLLTMMEDRFRDYLGTFFEDEGIPELRILFEASHEKLIGSKLMDSLKLALKPQLFKKLQENAPYYCPPYLPLYNFIQNKSQEQAPTFSIYQWQNYHAEFEKYLKEHYPDYSFKDVNRYIGLLIQNS